MNTLKNRLHKFLQQFKSVCKQCSRKPEEVKVLFATKYLNPDRFVRFLHICREIDVLPVAIGENRVQDAKEKIEYLKKSDRNFLSCFSLVMIGNLQTNKINKAINLFDEIHSIDSLELARALDERLKRVGEIMPVYLEVNVSGEKTKHGFSPFELEEVYDSLKLLKSLKIKGLMTMVPFVENREEVRPVFRRLRDLSDKYNLLTSMGMSNDWKIAIEEGSDMIRIGARIFGH